MADLEEKEEEETHATSSAADKEDLAWPDWDVAVKEENEENGEKIKNSKKKKKEFGCSLSASCRLNVDKEKKKERIIIDQWHG